MYLKYELNRVKFRLHNYRRVRRMLAIFPAGLFMRLITGNKYSALFGQHLGPTSFLSLT
jgi:hypothetical protein